MPLEPACLIERLARAPAAFRSAAGVFSAEEARWKPTLTDWSVLEIVCHVADEEEEDFAPRLRATLAGQAWTPLDLEGVAERRGYGRRDLETELARFERSRAANTDWLRTLFGGNPRPDLAAAHRHPRFGPIHAGDLLTSWSAHDALHLRQIAKRLHQIAAQEAERAGFGVGYAGAWSA